MVYDSGNGHAVGKFLGGLTQALPPFHEVAKMAGIELPAFLGEIAERSAAADREADEDGNNGDAS